MHKTKTTDPLYIFTDAATSSKMEIAIGAFLVLNQQMIDEYSTHTFENLSKKLAEIIIYKKYKSKKSTWSEIQTFIDALNYVSKKNASHQKVEIYSDCQSLGDLMIRRKEKLQANHFVTRSGKIHEHAELYKTLFSLTDTFKIKFVKIKGHDSKANLLSVHQKIFSILDKLSRHKLRTVL